MATYRFLLCDLLTDTPLGYLPLSGVSMERRISRQGALSGKMVATDAETVRVAKILHAYVGRSALWVYRDGQLWWGGIPWVVTPQQGQRGGVDVSVTATTFDSYAHHRRLYTDKGYTNVDQGTIIPSLWRAIQADPNGDIGVEAVNQVTGVLRTRTYQALELAPVGKLIEDLGDVIDGPEHTIDVWADEAGVRHKRLRVENQLAQGVTEPRIVFQRAAGGGGSLLDWSQARDAVDCGTAFLARGNTSTVDGNAGGELVAPTSTLVERTDLLDTGWPRLDVTEDYSDVTEVGTLQGYAEAAAANRGGAEEVNGYTVRVGDTGWNPNRIGEPVKLRIKDLWHDTITSRVVRPVGVSINVAERGQSETVTLLLGED